MPQCRTLMFIRLHAFKFSVTIQTSFVLLFVTLFMHLYCMWFCIGKLCGFPLAFPHVCSLCAHMRGNGKVKFHSRAIRQDTSSKCTHFLISHIGQPAAPQETNNGLVITPRQHTKELLARNSSDFTTEKHAYLPIQFMSDCTKGLPKEWRWVQISPHLFTPSPHVVSLLVKLALCDKALQRYSGN